MYIKTSSWLPKLKLDIVKVELSNNKCLSLIHVRTHGILTNLFKRWFWYPLKSSLCITLYPFKLKKTSWAASSIASQNPYFLFLPVLNTHIIMQNFSKNMWSFMPPKNCTLTPHSLLLWILSSSLSYHYLPCKPKVMLLHMWLHAIALHWIRNKSNTRLPLVKPCKINGCKPIKFQSK